MEATMRALIMYESIFGNTQRIARAIAEGLTGHARTTVTEVGDAPARLDTEWELLVIGGPTHMWGMSRPNTRADAGRQSPATPVSPGIGIREWLSHLPPGRPGLATATFDTRLGKPWWLTGSAARSAAKALRERGYPVVARESFTVLGTAGPLRAEEVERARQWGVRLTRMSAAAHSGPIVH
jgi:hypothetical protein